MPIDVLQADLNADEHASAVLDLLESYSRDAAGGGKPLSNYTRQNLIRRLLQREDTQVILAWDGSKPVGLVIAFEGFSTFNCMSLINIHDVVVLAEYRGQGITQKMFDAVETIARSRGCCKLTLEVLSENAAAQSAYRKAGFKAYELDPAMGQALFWEKKL